MLLIISALICRRGVDQQRQRIADVHHHRDVDHLGRAVEITECASPEATDPRQVAQAYLL